MFLKSAERFRDSGISFNMTPVVDIVFLLIVFFVVTFQFIGTEDSQVQLPAGCEFAESIDDSQMFPATITMRRTDQGEVSFAVGAEKIETANRTDLLQAARKSLNECLKTLPEDEAVVVLRIDKDISYGEAQYALAAAAESSATGLRLATLAETQREKE